MSQRPATKRRSIQGGTLDEQREHIRRPQAPAFMGDEPGFAAAADLGGTGILASERRPDLSGVVWRLRRLGWKAAWPGRTSDFDLWPIGTRHVSALVDRAGHFIWGHIPACAREHRVLSAGA